MKLATEKMIARVDGAIGWMIFNNPVRHNALSLEMWQAVGEILPAFQQDEAVRVVVMTGAGEKAFVSGADISEFDDKRDTAEAAEEYARVSEGGRAALADLEKPLIAMIRGYCLGGGLGTALAADIRVAAEGAQFAIPAARLGLGYGFAGVKVLTDLVGPAMAREILFTARRFTAEEAQQIGLINRLVPVDALEPTVRELAETIAANARLTIRAAKYAITEACKDSEARDLATLEAMVAACFDSADYAEGRLAFKQKRPPKFSGR